MRILLTAIIMLALAPHTFAQSSLVKPGKSGNAISYHGGPLMQGHSNVYVIGYGNWPDNSPTMQVLVELLANVGGTEYFKMNTQYYDSLGGRPNGILFFGGGRYDRTYSHGKELKETDFEAIITDQVTAGLPVDVNGIYLIIGTPDVSSDSAGFCQPGTPPFHGAFTLFGISLKYAFIGNPLQCPAVEAPQFVGPDGSLLPTPNGDLAADAMAAEVAHALNATVTNPLFDAWHDRNGLENADKCFGKFGQTYLTPNGARANMRLGTRHYLLPQSWVNAAIGYCSLSPGD